MAELADVIARLEPELGPATQPVPLDGGLTNRNYRVRFGTRETVVRLCGKDTAALGIDRSTETLATRRAAGLGIGPEVLWHLEDEDVLVCAFIEGTALDAPALRGTDCLRAAGRLLRAFHESGPLPTAFDVLGLVERQRTLTTTAPPGYDELLAIAQRIERALHRDVVACHNDLLPANFLRTPDGLRLVDWEYAGMNHRCFDLGNLSVNAGLGDAEEHLLLNAYWGGPPTPGQHAALKLMRFVSDLREAMWGVAQRALGGVEGVDYAAYAQEHFDRLRRTAADPRFEEWMTVAATA